MRFLFRLLRRLVLLVLVFLLALSVPVIYVEAACRPQITASDYEPVLPPTAHRPEARTLLTYPEWHIVHAYDDYAEVIAEGDPHDYQFGRSIIQFWTSLCTLSKETGTMGGFDTGTKQMVYVIGASFTAELAMKALYEETIGRGATMVRGDVRSPLDVVSADQARRYAQFLQQVPWYKWDFRADVAELEEKRGETRRDHERRFALGAEYSVKSLYAGVIENAVASVGADDLTLRIIVSGDLPAGLEGVTRIGATQGGTEIETPRYRALTGLIARMAAGGVDFVEIAGNDDIMLTVLSDDPDLTGALMSMPRQGYGDTRHLLLVKVNRLGELLRALDTSGLRLEHIHDY